MLMNGKSISKIGGKNFYSTPQPLLFRSSERTVGECKSFTKSEKMRFLILKNGKVLNMSRKDELLKIIDNDELFINLVDEIIFIEGQLIELKKLPFININPKNPLQQKATPAAKLYKELLQQYNNSLKVLARATGQDENSEDSPLRKWVKSRLANQREKNLDA